MEEDYSKIVRLIIKSAARKLNDSEQKRLDAWINARDYRRQLAENLRKLGLPKEGEFFNTIDKDTAWKKIQAEVASRPGVPPLPDRPQTASVNWQSMKTRVIAFIHEHGKAVAVVATTTVGLFSFTAGYCLNKYLDKHMRNGPPPIQIADILYSVSTPMGSKSNVMLPDGSNLILNVASSVKVTHKVKARNSLVELAEGEVLFDVNPKEHAQNQPFVVQVKQLTFTATGTSFDIRAYALDSTIRATLLSGKNLLVQRSGIQKDLKPGQVYVLNSDGTDTVEGLPNTTIKIPWREGMFTFNDEPLVHVVEEIARHYNTKVIFKDKDRLNSHVTMDVSRNSSIEYVLNIIQFTNKMHYTLNDNTVTVMP